MIDAAADGHRVLLQDSPTRRRLAGIDEIDLQVRDPVDERSGLRRDSAESAQEVEGGALGDENALVSPAHSEQGGGPQQPHTVLDAGFALDLKLGIDPLKDRFGDRKAADDHRCPGFDSRLPEALGVDHELGGEVARADILLDRHLDEGEPAFVRR